ncbi:MAG: aerotolerance regulator BatA [Candidatus Cloacimonadota bacterium]|nr:MAG: aerotolerance regulator BatA [Candidatus Cloacimonadota bacterium]PIE78905.1 MAG: aerotolerance regulator BatA [Candidatus Delongbacteria bacterium]
MEFADPTYLYLLFLIPIIFTFIVKKRKTAYFRVSDFRLLEGVKPTLRSRFYFLPTLFKLLAIALIIVALARPRSSIENRETTTEGIDIILTLDVSTSMKAMDFSPNRFRAAIDVALNFIKGRKNDRIGLVIFAGESYTQCPLTTDYGILQELLSKVKMEQIEDGTAIGTALANSVNRLRESKSKSKVVILLTDGENNKGEIDPETAAEAAAAIDVRIYTIGIGKKRAKYPYGKDFFGKDIIRELDFKIDEKMLSEIAETTGGKFYRATNIEKLEKIYDEIDGLEKNKIKTNFYKTYTEKFRDFLIPGIILLLLSFILDRTYFRRSI